MSLEVGQEPDAFFPLVDVLTSPDVSPAKDKLSTEEIQEGSEPMSFDVLVSGSSEVFEEKISKARAYAQWLGTDNASSFTGHIFISGKYYVINDHDVHLPSTLFQRAPTHRQSSRTFLRCNLVSDRHFSISNRILFFSRIVLILQSILIKSVRVKLRMIRRTRSELFLWCTDYN